MNKIVQIPASEWYKLKGMIERIAQRSDIENMINEEQAAELLGITKESLRNKLRKNFLEDMYTVGVGGNRFYYKDRLMGLSKKSKYGTWQSS